MRGFMAIAVVAGVAACAPPVPDSNPDRGRGVGFDSYSEYQREQQAREAALSQPVLPPVDPVSAAPLDSADVAQPQSTVPGALPQAASVQPSAQPRAGASPQPVQTAAAPAQQDAADIAARTRAALSNSGEEPVQASPSNPAPMIINNPGISDEQDFDAVASRQSIESDAERLARQRAQYQVIAPTDVPQRDADVPNIVKYALSTRHPKGQRVLRRVGFNLAAKNRRNCASFDSDDAAQEEFLRLGGPQRDRLALDPDGDGYACGWDPAPFRRVVGN